jgi:glycosyltransferase involved in cell wall biosynthesis
LFTALAHLDRNLATGDNFGQRAMAMHGSGAVRILYMTYDGLTSLIGQSQVWPYLKGLTEAGHEFDVISFEHEDRRKQIGNAVSRDVEASAITWHPCNFRTRPPVLAKLLDQREMIATAGRIAASGRVDAIHARSYVAADVALKLKRRFGLPFIFDMRGFWVDQRLEGGRWPQSNPLYRALYRRWKVKEADFTSNAGHIIVLSEAARQAVQSWDSYRGQPVTVIPCCIDHQAFPVRTAGTRSAARARLGIEAGATVLVYLGSVGTVYLLPEMLRFYDKVRRARPGAKFLFIGAHSAEHLIAEARAARVEIDTDDLRLQFSEHDEVSFWLAAADLALCLITPKPSSRGVSPTKLAEYLACGLPVVVNDGVGDVREIIEQIGAGAVLSSMSDDDMDGVIARLDDILAIDPGALRERSCKVHDMPVALAKYRQVYDSIATVNPERGA